jgi:hypothetical protein
MTKIKQYNLSKKIGEGFCHEEAGGISGLLLGGQASQQATLQTRSDFYIFPEMKLRVLSA